MESLTMSPKKTVKQDQAHTKNRRPQWSIRSLLLWTTVIGFQLALFRLSLVIGFCFLFVVMPALLVAWMSRVARWRRDTSRFVIKAWAGLFCVGLPVATCFFAAYSQFPPPNFFWIQFVGLVMFAAPGAFAALFYYFFMISLYDAMDKTPGPASLKYRREMPEKLPGSLEQHSSPQVCQTHLLNLT
jgi:hypothetical protein